MLSAVSGSSSVLWTCSGLIHHAGVSGVAPVGQHCKMHGSLWKWRGVLTTTMSPTLHHLLASKHILTPKVCGVILLDKWCGSKWFYLPVFMGSDVSTVFSHDISSVLPGQWFVLIAGEGNCSSVTRQEIDLTTVHLLHINQHKLCYWFSPG